MTSKSERFQQLVEKTYGSIYSKQRVLNIHAKSHSWRCVEISRIAARKNETIMYRVKECYPIDFYTEESLYEISTSHCGIDIYAKSNLPHVVSGAYYSVLKYLMNRW